jgi:hypothetical protein
MNQIKGHAAEFAAAAGPALVAFGIKAADAFKDVAIAAQDMSGATGLSVEEASRWIAVGDDFGLTADELTTSLGKVVTAIDDNKWEKYGIDTRDASGEALAANEILLQTFDALSKETNATERARMAKELLGKGYENLAPLIGKTRDELEDYLGAVSDGQVITDKEAEKARKLALAQDAINDAIQEVTLAVGGFVAEMGPAIQHTADMAMKAADLMDELGPLADIMMSVVSPTYALSKAKGLLGEKIDLEKISLEDLKAKLEETGFTIEQQAEWVDMWREVQQKATGAVKDTTSALPAFSSGLDQVDRSARDFADEIATAEAKVRALDDAYNQLIGSLDQEEKWARFNQAVWDYADGSGDAAAEMRDWKRAAADVIQSLDDMPDEQKTKLLMEINEGDKATVDAVLFKWQQGINVPVRFQGQGQVGFEKKAKGGPVRAGVPYIVGDRPDGSLTPYSEVFIPSSDGTIVNASATRQLVGAVAGAGSSVVNYVTVQVPPTVDKAAVGREVAEMLLAYQREVGPVFVTTRS